MPTLNFLGKTFVQNHHLAVPHRQLVPKPELSVFENSIYTNDSVEAELIHQNPNAKSQIKQPSVCSLHDNLIIQGDNLEALKALLPTYSGQVKCIYIDPPYNTGNENWVYNDNLKAPMIKEWLGKTVGKDGEDLTRHDKWLCMMTPRLKLLRELLTEDGVIFVSIDDNEQANLKLLMDEVFGEGNFISNIIWQKKYSPQNDAKYLSDDHDFIICYAKSKVQGDTTIGWKINLLDRTEEQNARYTNRDNDLRGVWKAENLSVRTYSANNDYEILLPSGRSVKPPQGRCWCVSQSKFEELKLDKRIWFGDNGDNVPALKRFLSDVQDGTVSKTIWGYDEVGHNQSAKQEIKEIFADSNEPFETPKPSTLIQKILKLATNPGDIILDSFAGSGTTAQAVLELNSEDGGNRKFILVEMEQYADSITAERVRRVIKGVPNSRKENLKAGLGGGFSYFELGSAIEMEQILTGTNLPEWSEFARYLFYTATGDQWNESVLTTEAGSTPPVISATNIPVFIGSSAHYDVYLMYQGDLDWLKTTSLTLDMVRAMPKPPAGKRNLIFGPTKYVDDDNLRINQCLFQQLPYEIYKLER
jgi:adenine-specific DNA-methyltransferase